MLDFYGIGCIFSLTCIPAAEPKFQVPLIIDFWACALTVWMFAVMPRYQVCGSQERTYPTVHFERYYEHGRLD